MTSVKDSFLSSLNIEILDNAVIIKNSKKRNYLAIFLAAIFIPITLFLAFAFYTRARFIDGSFFLGLAILIFYVTWNLNSNGLYSTTIYYFIDKLIIRKSEFKRLKSKNESYTSLHGIALATKSVGGHTSAYEEGNTDFRKTIILDTDRGDIPLLTYYSRKEQLEESAEKFIEFLKNKLPVSLNRSQ